jgi:HSP20 family protein
MALRVMPWPFREIKVEEFVEGDQLVVRAEVPGVDPDRDIDVSVENNVLTISAERRESNREKFERGFHSEFRYGSFVRQVRLPIPDARSSYRNLAWTWRFMAEKASRGPRSRGIPRRIQGCPSNC